MRRTTNVASEMMNEHLFANRIDNQSWQQTDIDPALWRIFYLLDLCEWSSLKFVFLQHHNHVSASCDTSSGPGARGELWSINWLSLHTWTVNQGGQQQGSMGYERRSFKGGGCHNVENLKVSRRTSPIFTKINKIFNGLRNKICGGGRVRQHQKGFGSVTSITRHHGEVAIISLISSVILLNCIWDWLNQHVMCPVPDLPVLCRTSLAPWPRGMFVEKWLVSFRWSEGPLARISLPWWVWFNSLSMEELRACR